MNDCLWSMVWEHHFHNILILPKASKGEPNLMIQIFSSFPFYVGLLKSHVFAIQIILFLLFQFKFHSNIP